MKKKEVNSILIEQTKRRNKIVSYTCLIIIIFILSLSCLFLFINKNKSYYVTYDEKSDIDYKVYLNDNDFFTNNYLDEDSKYIASLINYITATMKYEVSMDKDNIDFTYKYRIDAVIDVKESSSDTKTLFTKTIPILNEKTKNTSNSHITINENVNIDYNEYNDLIKNFNSFYDLEDMISTLTINMYVDVIGSCDEFTSDSNDTSVISLSIPLTTKTVEIDIKDNLVNNDNKILLCKKSSPFIYFTLGAGIGLLLLGFYLIYVLITYIVTTRSAQTIYEVNLKKILNNYHSYIQKISNKMEVSDVLGLRINRKSTYKDCQFYKLENFTDMLEIRDSISAPIIMFENERNTATYFMILNVVNKAVYIYTLRVDDIKKEMKNNS